MARRAIAALPKISDGTRAVRPDIGMKGNGYGAYAIIAVRIHGSIYFCDSKPVNGNASDTNKHPEGLVSVRTNTKDIPIGVAQHPVSLVRAVSGGSRHAHAQINAASRYDVPWEWDDGGRADQAAAGIYQGIAWRPGASADILQPPDLGERLPWVKETAIRDGHVADKAGDITRNGNGSGCRRLGRRLGWSWRW